jgi:hypothetical protein
LGQKSLYTLHRVDTSMIWESSLHNSNYKWLSYNLWFTFIYYFKYISFTAKQMDTLFSNFSSIDNSLVNSLINKHKKFENTPIRFSYHIELYCLEFLNHLILLNIFFLTDLSFFKLKKKKNNKYKKKSLNTFFF